MYLIYNFYLCTEFLEKQILKDMRIAVIALGVVCVMGSCTPAVKSSKGIVCDASMNTVAIVTDKNDTLSFSTMDANKDEVNGLLLNDTLEVFYNGKYTPGMSATKLVQYPQSHKVGADRDEHGCLGSAGYVWCEVLQDCIRLFEKGIRLENVEGNNIPAFIVFSPDSTRLELFLPNNEPNEILERRSLPSGGYAWNVEDDDTKNVRFVDGQWTITQRDQLLYHQKVNSADKE